MSSATLIRPWNIRAGDRFAIRDETRVPARELVYEATADAAPDRGAISGARCWIIPRRLVSASDGRPDVFGGRTPARVYSDERVRRVSRGGSSS